MLGSHTIKTWSSTQSVIALSSGEAEYYGIVKGCSQGLGIKSMLEELNVCWNLRVKTDASAAIGIAKRRGLGKVRHIEVHQLWVQEQVTSGRIRLLKVPGTENLADALTKHVDRANIEMHMQGTGLKIVEGRNKIAFQA